jgi:transcriptional antiterminator RfaH
MVDRRNRSSSGRIRVSHNPLFPGYVFMVGAEEQRSSALTTHCISRSIEVSDSEQLVYDLRQIHQLIHSGAPLTAEARIEPGMQIRVRSGPLAGLEGTVVQRRGAERLLVVVHFLQRGASVEIADCQVERI